jgi:hypothetical protein
MIANSFVPFVMPVNRRFKLLLVLASLGIATVAYGISFAWPAYDWDLRVPSPDGRYDLVVLRGDAAAFADFSYEIYLFPRSLTPHDQSKASRVWLTPTWRGRKYLIYSGYSYPMFRWTSEHAIEIDLNDHNPEPFVLEPVKRFEGSDQAVVVSIVFGKQDGANALP